MPQSMTVTAPNGKQLTITGDRVPTEAELHDIFAKAGVDVAAPAPAAGALERGATQFYDKSPLAAVVAGAKGTANVIAHPLDTYFGLKPMASTVADLAKAQWDEAVKAAEAAKRAAGGDALSASEALGHGLAAVLPVLGPAAANVGEHFASAPPTTDAAGSKWVQGDVAGGVGGALGLLMPFAVKAGLELKNAANPAKATLLERQAREQVTQKVLAPGNPRYQPTAAKIAPEVLDRNLSKGIGRFGDARAELRQLAETGKADAIQRIEASWNDNPTQPLATSAIVDGLDTEIRKSYVSGKLVPGEEARVKALQAQRDFVASHGPTIPASDMRQLRQVLDKQASEAGMYVSRGDATFAPVAQSAKKAADLARQQLAADRPGAEAPNADFTFWARLDDVLDPTKGRPKQTGYVPSGITGGMAATGAIVGDSAKGLPVVGPLIGSQLLPRLKALVNSPAWELTSAQKKLALADALRDGRAGQAQTLMTKIAVMAPRGVPGWSVAAAAPAAASTPDNTRTRGR